MMDSKALPWAFGLLVLVCATTASSSGSLALLNARAEIRHKEGADEPLTNPSLPDWTIYHKTDDLLQEVKELAENCEYARVSGTSANLEDGTPDVPVIVLGHGVNSRFRSMVSAALHERVQMVAVFGEHGRELISSEVALQLVRLVCKETGAAADAAREELHRSEIHVVPVLGQSSRRLVEQGEMCERLNANGVDLNRNWGNEWGKNDHTSDSAEERPGSGPFSEVETRALKHLVEQLQAAAFVSFHSGDAAILTPWDHRPDPPEGEDHRRLSAVAAQVAKQHCPDCPVGNVYRLFGYNAYGTSVDWAFGTARVPFVYTWEIYGDTDSHVDDCFRMFNPLDSDTYKEVVDNWSRALFTLAGAIHSVISELDDLPAPEPISGSKRSRVSTPHRRDGFATEHRRRGQGGNAPPTFASPLNELLAGLVALGLFGALAYFVRTRVIKGPAPALPSLKEA